MSNNNARRPVQDWYGFPRTTRGFITFEQVFPGSLFFIRQEISRGQQYPSRDRTLYRKSRDGFYAEAVDNSKPACLYPEDLCVPVRNS